MIQVINLAIRACGPNDLRHGVGKLPETLFLLGRLSLGPLPLSDISGEAARVHELSIAPKHARVDQHLLDRTVLAPKPRGIFSQLLARLQSLENVADHLLVGMKFG